MRAIEPKRKAEYKKVARLKMLRGAIVFLAHSVQKEIGVISTFDSDWE